VADFPALPWWTDAYLADCLHLTDAEHGRYMLLLAHMWRSPGCRIPNDDEWLARRFRRTVEEVQDHIRPLIREFCQSNGNWVWQKRLLREWQYVHKRSKTQSENAKARWNKEKEKSHRISQPDATRQSRGNAPTPTPLIDTKKVETRTTAARVAPPPRTIAEAAQSLSNALTAHTRQKIPNATPEQVKQLWINATIGFAKEILSKVEVERLIGAYQAGEKWAVVEMNRISDLRKARFAERERRSTA
jgi:uncharacterized protein YdaU (DUF1376 family)